MATLQQEIEFSNLLNRNIQTINSICLRYCGGNAFYFDELRQECAMAIWAEVSRHSLDRFRGESTEATWIYQIAFHAVANYLRNPNHQEFLSRCDLSDMNGRPDSEMTNGWNLLDELSEHLDNRERKLLDHYLNDDSYSAIARVEGITESNARKRMSRLLNKLKMLVMPRASASAPRDEDKPPDKIDEKILIHK